MPSSYTCLRFHLIWSTKHREPLLIDEVRTRMFSYIGGILRNDGGALLAAGGMPDHVHLLADIGEVHSVADAVRDINRMPPDGFTRRIRNSQIRLNIIEGVRFRKSSSSFCSGMRSHMTAVICGSSLDG